MIPWRLIGLIVALIAIIAIPALVVRSCDARHSRAAQSRVNQAQGTAFQNSASDAVRTLGNDSAASEASENLTQSNDAKIRAAEGANAAVDPAARDAGLAALCRRQTYAHDPRCQHP